MKNFDCQNEVISILNAESTEEGQKVLALVNKEAEIFSEHFPEAPILPGAFIISFIFNLHCLFFKEKNLVLDSVEKFTFEKRIIPGSILEIFSKYIFVNDEVKVKTIVKDGDGKPYNKGLFIYRRNKE